MTDILQALLDWATTFLQHYGYWAIFLLMFLETGLILHGVPTELVMTVGALPLMHTPTDVLWVVLVGTLGATAGSQFVYWVARYGGRPFLLRHRHFFHLDEKRADRMERTFRRPAGLFFVFACRLLPIIRGLVSIPAGLARMNGWIYFLLSTLGAALFNFILAYTAYLTHRVPDSPPARFVVAVQRHVADNWVALTVITCLLALLLLVAWLNREALGKHYRRHMPEGWEGKAVVTLLALVLLGAFFVAVPATLSGFANQGTDTGAEAVRSTAPWIIPLLFLVTLFVLAGLILLIRRELAAGLSWLAGKREQRAERKDAEMPTPEQEDPAKPG
jgi:membrane protein DedA with SNARE-associated domain